ncbi:MAG TPA: ABC transporter permease [Eubacteriales bacterium]|jgi:spermidine/putrescine transport system permease protein|nr:ABC transporter permease [Clostridia bacterium]HRR89311.1 ABC transporter permease [Eubacteriales bacterium]HRU84730.1 ABC transporter permease [Eubacteriales bacterium]
MVKKVLAKAYIFLILALLYAPIVLIVVYSFSNSSTFSFSQGFNFDAYRSIFTSSKTPELLSAIKNTLIIAAVSAGASTLLGSIAAIGIFSLKKRSRSLVEGINQIPMINSEIVMAVSLMIFFVTLDFPEGYLRLILAHIAFCTPYVVLSVMPKLTTMDPNIYEAALDLGASPSKAMVKVLFPIMAPGVISGLLLSFTLSMDDFIITQINKGAATGINTLSTYIYADARLKGLSPFWFAIFTIIFVLVFVILLIVNVNASKRRVKKHENF